MRMNLELRLRCFSPYVNSGAATYFIHRIADKPSGWFSQTGEGFDTPGLSFTLDPIYHDPDDPVRRVELRS